MLLRLVGLIGYRLTSTNTAITLRYRRCRVAKAKPRLSATTVGPIFPSGRASGECHAWNTLSEIRLSVPGLQIGFSSVNGPLWLRRYNGVGAAPRRSGGGGFDLDFARGLTSLIVCWAAASCRAPAY